MPENVNGYPGFADDEPTPQTVTEVEALIADARRSMSAARLMKVLPDLQRQLADARARESQTVSAYVPRPHELRARAIAGSIALGMPDAQAEAEVDAALAQDEQARAVLSAVETIKATGGRVQIAGVVITPCDPHGTPLDFDAPTPQQWAIQAGWLIEPNGTDEPTPLVQLSTLDGYDSLAAELAPAAARRIAETLRALDEVGLRLSIKAAPDMEPERLEKFLDTMAETVERTLAEAKAKVTGGTTS